MVYPLQIAEDLNCGAQEGSRGIDLFGQYRRNAAEHHISDDPAADRCDDAQQHGQLHIMNMRIDLVSTECGKKTNPTASKKSVG